MGLFQHTSSAMSSRISAANTTAWRRQAPAPQSQCWSSGHVIQDLLSSSRSDTTKMVWAHSIHWKIPWSSIAEIFWDSRFGGNMGNTWYLWHPVAATHEMSLSINKFVVSSLHIWKGYLCWPVFQCHSQNKTVRRTARKSWDERRERRWNNFILRIPSSGKFVSLG